MQKMHGKLRMGSLDLNITGDSKQKDSSIKQPADEESRGGKKKRLI